MSQENIESVLGVRTPVAAFVEPTRRTLDERLLARVPVLARGFAFAYSRLRPSSRLRRAFTARSTRRFNAAFNRRDFEVLLPFLDPEVEFEGAESLIGGFSVPDMPAVQRGREGYRRMFEGLIEVWDDLELHPEEVIDLGDRLLGVGRATGHGRLSGVALDMPLFQVLTLRNGLIVRQSDFGEREKALQAAGLRE